MLWIILTLMAALAAVGLAVPLVRRHDAARQPRNETIATLKAQIDEIDGQAATGALPSEDADALKADVNRRVLAEGRTPETPARPLGERALLGLALGLVTLVVLASTGLYLAIGRPDIATGAKLPDAAATAATSDHPQGDVDSMIAMLEQQMKQQPNSAEGWRMLGWSYLQTNRNAEAADAYGRAAALEPGNSEYHSAQGEATALAAEGRVNPAAEAAFRRALAADPTDPRARYYLAVAKDQKGDAKGAMNDWIAMLKTAPADAPWAAEVRAFVEKTAQARGMDISGRLPPAPVAASAPAGPTAADVAAAEQMSDADRQAMIQGMVDRLTQRLKANPLDRAGWEQLMRSYMVLQRPDDAAAAYRDATRALTAAPAERDAVRKTAASLGVPGV